MRSASIPTLIKLGQDTQEAFSRIKSPTLILVRSEADADSEWSQKFAQAALELKNEFFFVVTGTKDRVAANLVG